MLLDLFRRGALCCSGKGQAEDDGITFDAKVKVVRTDAGASFIMSWLTLPVPMPSSYAFMIPEIPLEY